MNPMGSNVREDHEATTPSEVETDERLDLWLDGKLSDEERRQFEAELEQNPDQREEAHSLASILSVVRNLPDEQAPRTLLSDVQNQLRERTGGRVYGGPRLYVRFPYEALVQSLLLIGAVLFFALASPKPPKLIVIEPKDFLVSGSDLGIALRVLTEFGTFKNEQVGLDAQGMRRVVGEVPNERMDALRTEVSLYPSMRIDSEAPLEGGWTRVRVSIRP